MHFILHSRLLFYVFDLQVDATSGKTYTYRQLIDRVERLAAGLQRYGVREGDVICIFSPNHIDFLPFFYASTLVNAVLQCINPLFTKGMQYFLISTARYPIYFHAR